MFDYVVAIERKLFVELIFYASMADENIDFAIMASLVHKLVTWLLGCFMIILGMNECEY